jgi:hypothetical protein
MGFRPDSEAPEFMEYDICQGNGKVKEKNFEWR